MNGRKLAPIGLTVATVLLGTTGCSVVTDYPDQTLEARNHFAAGRFTEAYNGLEQGLQRDLDKVCYVLERGMIVHTAGDFEKSNADFKTALGLFEEYEQESTGAQVGQQAMSLLINEKTIPYKGEMFEKALIHIFWGMNYLCAGQTQERLDEAHVEIRRTNQRLKELREEYEEELEEARGEKEGETEDGTSVDCSAAMSKMTEELDKARADQQAVVDSVSNVYDLAIGHYLSAVIYEEQADRGYSYELDNARISYERVYDMNPGFPLIKEDLLRISKKLRDQEAYDKWKETFGGGDWTPQSGTGDVFILYSCGLAPEKDELAVRFPIFIPGLMKNPLTDTVYGKIAIPKYKTRPTPEAYITLLKGSDALAQSYSLTNIEAVAIKFLWDRMLLLSIKQAVRLGIKAAATYIAAQAALQSGGAGGVMGNVGIRVAGAVLTEISEQADLRSWLTLPRNLQVLRVTVPAGEYPDLSIGVHGQGGGKLNSLKLGKVTVPEGRRLFINCRSVNGNIFANMAKGADEIGEAPEPKWGMSNDGGSDDGEYAGDGGDGGASDDDRRRVFDFGGKRR